MNQVEMKENEMYRKMVLVITMILLMIISISMSFNTTVLSSVGGI